MLQPIEPPAASRSSLSHPRDLGGPWHSEAACRSDEAGLFFAPSKEPTAARLSREEAAKRVCAQCHVQTACLEHALAFREKEGVWGGTTERERRRIVRQRRRSA
mgnify:CR=1 FL=1